VAVTYRESKKYQLPKQDWMLHFDALYRTAKSVMPPTLGRVRPYVSLDTKQGAEIKESSLADALDTAQRETLSVTRVYAAFYTQEKPLVATLTLSGRPATGDFWFEVRTKDEGFFHVAHKRIEREVEEIRSTVKAGRETESQSRMKREAVLRRAVGDRVAGSASANAAPTPRSESGSGSRQWWTRAKKAWAIVVGLVVFLSGVATIVQTFK
jgi:hypothetical protein